MRITNTILFIDICSSDTWFFHFHVTHRVIFHLVEMDTDGDEETQKKKRWNRLTGGPWRKKPFHTKTKHTDPKSDWSGENIARQRAHIKKWCHFCFLSRHDFNSIFTIRFSPKLKWMSYWTPRRMDVIYTILNTWIDNTECVFLHRSICVLCSQFFSASSSSPAAAASWFVLITPKEIATVRSVQNLTAWRICSKRPPKTAI